MFILYSERPEPGDQPYADDECNELHGSANTKEIPAGILSKCFYEHVGTIASGCHKAGSTANCDGYEKRLGIDPEQLSGNNSNGKHQGYCGVVGDYFGKKGGEALNAPLRKKLRIFSRFIKKQPRWAVTLLVYGYFSFAPLPNDIITFPLGLAGYPFKKIWVPAVLGDITFVIWVSFLFV